MDINKTRILLNSIFNLFKDCQKEENWLTNRYEDINEVKNTKWKLSHYEYFLQPLEKLVSTVTELNDCPNETITLLINQTRTICEKIQELRILMNKNEEDLNAQEKQKIIDIMSDILSQYKNFNTDTTNQIKLYDKELQKITILNIRQITSGNYLYHAIKTKYVEEILDRGTILGYTTQRYWDKGLRYKDDHPEYNNSFFMKGISMTRNLDYALSWEGVTLIFDKNKISQKHPIENYAWNYHLARGTGHFKKETEEFIVLSKKNKTYKNRDNQEWIEEMKQAKEDLDEHLKELDPEDQEYYKNFYKTTYEDKIDNINIADISQAEGEFDFTKNDALVGIIMCSYLIEIFGLDNSMIQKVIHHPKFIGIIDR